MNSVTLIGAANIDIQGFTFEKLITGDSNPGRVRVCPGGVSRNIAENLSKLGVKVELITAIGGGPNGKYIVSSCEKSGIGINRSLVLPDKESSTYLAIMDEKGDMALALSDMSISDEITVEYIKKVKDVLEKSSIIEIDPCLSTEVIQYIIQEFKDIPIYLDPVSIGKSRKIKNSLGGIHTLKLNKMEAGYLSGIDIRKEQDIKQVSLFFLSQGVQNIYITLGRNGVYYDNGRVSGFVRPPSIEIINATGAGDAFMAGVMYGDLHGYTMEKTAVFASGASIMALNSIETVSADISVKEIEKIIKEKF